MPDTETAPTTFQQAYAAAKEQVAATETPAEGETESQAATTQTAEEPAKAPDQPVESAEEQLLSDDEYDKLKDDPVKLRKALQKAFTQKTQRLAEQRRNIESWQQVIKSYEENPVETAKFLAAQAGLRIADDSQQKAESARDQKVEAQTSAIFDELRTLVGEENAPFAQGLAEIFERNMKNLARSIAQEEVAPIRQQYKSALEQSMADQGEKDLAAAKTRHEDWGEHEEKIVELSRRFVPPPNSDVTAAEYLDTLYDLATRDKLKATAKQEVLSRLNKAAKSAEPQTAGVKAEIVTPVAPKNATFRDAWAAAKRGERWD